MTQLQRVYNISGLTIRKNLNPQIDTYLVEITSVIWYRKRKKDAAIKRKKSNKKIHSATMNSGRGENNRNDSYKQGKLIFSRVYQYSINYLQ